MRPFLTATCLLAGLVCLAVAPGPVAAWVSLSVFGLLGASHTLRRGMLDIHNDF